MWLHFPYHPTAGGRLTAWDNDRHTVFVVDDDEAVCDALGMLLRAAGLRVETFCSASLFLKAYRPGSSACLILDIRMPGMSGLDLQDELYKRRISIPIIFLTGHGDVPMAVRALKKAPLTSLKSRMNKSGWYWPCSTRCVRTMGVRRCQADMTKTHRIWPPGWPRFPNVSVKSWSEFWRAGKHGKFRRSCTSASKQWSFTALTSGKSLASHRKPNCSACSSRPKEELEADVPRNLTDPSQGDLWLRTKFSS